MMAKQTGLIHCDLKLFRNNSEGDLSRYVNNNLQYLHSDVLQSKVKLFLVTCSINRFEMILYQGTIIYLFTSLPVTSHFLITGFSVY